MNPLNINLYLLDGSPDGVVVVSSPNWTGECLKVSRLNIDKELIRYKESTKVGVYFLFGINESHAKVVYVGESEDVYYRINQHLKDNDKSWFEEVVIFTAKDNFLTRGHVQRLEHKLIIDIQKIQKSLMKYKLDNRNNGTDAHLPEHTQADINNFFDYIILIMPLLGFSDLFSVQSKELTINTTPQKVFHYLEAKGVLINNIFKVHKGSKISKVEIPSCLDSTKAMRRQLIEEKIINASDFTFTVDYDFTSPSSAGNVVYGGPVNGWLVWKNSEGKTLSEIERDKYQGK